MRNAPAPMQPVKYSLTRLGGGVTQTGVSFPGVST